MFAWRLHAASAVSKSDETTPQCLCGVTVGRPIPCYNRRASNVELSWSHSNGHDARIPALPTSKVESNSACKSHHVLADRWSSTCRAPEGSEALPPSSAAGTVPAVRASSLGRVVQEVRSTAQTRLRTLPAHETAQCSLKSRQCSQISLAPLLPSLPPRLPGFCCHFGAAPLFARFPRRLQNVALLRERAAGMVQGMQVRAL